MLFCFQPISIDFILDSFQKYGPIEHIELFVDYDNRSHSANVTFKQSTSVHSAIEFHRKTDSNVKLIVPVHTDFQPDCPFDSSYLYNLPNELLIKIFEFCGIRTLASLSLSSKKFKELILAVIFPKTFKLTPGAFPHWKYTETLSNFRKNDVKLMQVILTASQLVKAINPKLFTIKVVEIFNCWTFELQFSSVTEYSTLTIDSSFFLPQFVSEFDLIAKRIDCLVIVSFENFKAFLWRNRFIFPNTRRLELQGKSKAPTDINYECILSTVPSVEEIFIRNLLFDWPIQNLTHLARSNNVRSITFERCCLKRKIFYNGICTLAKGLKSKQRQWPLVIRYNDVEYQKGDFNNEMKALLNKVSVVKMFNFLSFIKMPK